MQELLFLAHRIPYPPNKGDKIRSYHILRRLARDYRVHLGAFVDDADDWRHQRNLEELCASVCLVPLGACTGRLRSLTGFLTGEPLTLPYYRSARLAAWVRGHLATGRVRRGFVFSSSMAQYLDQAEGMRRVLDFVDVDSEKWRQYAAAHRWPMSTVYRREGARLLAYERRQAARFDASIFVTESEVALFRRLAPETGERVAAIENGVDGDYFAPRDGYPDPYPPGARVLVFTGAMDYWANVDAVRWFAHEVFPAVRAQVRDARFYVVGARPAAAVRALAALEGVQVTGAVEDMRPYLAHARAAVAPLRIARGVQNKVLEAMAMARPVLATPQAWDGLCPAAWAQDYITDDTVTMAARAVALLTGADRGRGADGREFVLRHHDWRANLDRLIPMIEGETRPGSGHASRAVAVH